MNMVKDLEFLEEEVSLETSYSMINELPDESEGPVGKLLDWFKKNWNIGPEQEMLGTST